MFSINRSILLLVVGLLMSITVMAQDVTTEGLRPDAPQYALQGDYIVGTQDLVIDGEVPLDITVWYPAQNPDNAEASVTYPYVIKLGMPDANATVTGNAIVDAPYNLEDGSHPLVVLSSGFLLGRTGYVWLAEHLASHGFVVIAPEHGEQLDETLSDFSKYAILRPQTITAVLDYVDMQTIEGDELLGLIDTEQVAVIGHSLGGYTSLAIAGAQLDLTAMADFCASAEQAGDPSAWLCGLILPFASEDGRPCRT